MPPVILYDNPSRFGKGTCWSPNVWKTRLVLNYKGIDYKTQWLEGAEIAPAFQSFGIQPHSPDKKQLAPYTIPAVCVNGAYIMESSSIAKALERVHPEPSIHLDSPLTAQVQRVWVSIVAPLAAVLVPRMPRECLNEATASFHRAARRKTYGMSLEQLEATRGGEQAWEKAQPGLAALVSLLKADPSGPFFMGKTPSYGDFLIVGVLEWCRCLGGDCFRRIVRVDPVVQELYDACRPWLERNDY